MRPLPTHLRTVLAAAASSVLCASSASAQLFTFDTSRQGWQVYSIPYNGVFIDPFIEASQIPAFDATTGLPPGSLRVADLAAETWIGEQTQLAGNRTADYGTTLEFDIYYRFRDNAAYGAVALAGPNFSLFISQPAPTLNTWLHWSFPLMAGSWHVNAIDGPLANTVQFLQVLSDLRGVFIHTEWNTGPDDTSVDNIRFGFVSLACNIADITLIGGTAEDPGMPDQQLTVDDIIVFVNLFSDGRGCPGSASCNRADVTGIGGPPEAPDGQLTVDDLIAFVNAFSEGC